MGRADGREDRAAHRDRAAARAARRVPRGLRGRAHHRPGRAVPGSPRRGPDLRQPGAALGPGAAGVLPVRPVGGGRRVHPGVLRRRVHGRGERLDVPRLAADGRRRSSARRRRSRRWAAPRMHATVSGCGDNLVQDDDEAVDAAKRWLSYLPRIVEGSRRRWLPARAPRAEREADRDDGPGAGAARVRHAQGDRRDRRRGLVLRDQAAVRPRARRSGSRGSTVSRSGSSRTTRCTSAACCSSTARTRRRGSSGCATRSTSRCCSSPTCPAS